MRLKLEHCLLYAVTDTAWLRGQTLAQQVETLAAGYDYPIKIAVMGCVVNGPGEAKEADLGIAGGRGEGLLIKKGEIVKKLPEGELLAALKDELDHWEG